ncbi:PaeR7I family type II restriction endonuclease [Xanthomonas arboricola]|uniref:PaeR7I family type II restriction endonuclease n=1 Tax=Xanthomonas arboricola TaxID=56448 RepID=UPI001AF941A1|nr:PaeR7I family type II restriction endonuclease [Xanthomonas arboricola]CAD7377137.1 restriction endonuclease [Xanthomonas arboricola]CAG2084824.1 restriction endonuclease [Xanthomonas arboricola pv. juglandis]
MTLDLADFDAKAREAIKAFWTGRSAAIQKQLDAGVEGQGGRAGVVGGKNMDGFLLLIQEVVRANGLAHAKILLKKGVVTLPGYFRPTKMWDLLVMNDGRLIAALELKSQVGSFGNNFNNRTEEAIGTSHDFWTAYREGALGDQAPPFVGWLMLVEDSEDSSRAVRDKSPHFPVFPEFQGASYAKRYEILCRRLVQEKLYTQAALMLSPVSAASDGLYSGLSEITSLKNFVASLAAHCAAEATRTL